MQLPAVGMTLNKSATGYRLRPAASTLSAEHRTSIRKIRTRRKGGMTLLEAQILQRALRSGLDSQWAQHASNAERVAAGALMNTGHLVIRRDLMVVSPEVEAALTPAPQT
jgi:hypothetical protein